MSIDQNYTEICLVNHIENPEAGYSVLVIAEVKQPSGIDRNFHVYFRREFADNYFSSSCQEEKLFRQWALVKIEENLGEEGSPVRLNVVKEDLPWAGAIESGRKKSVSEEIKKGIFKYLPERKIGFHIS